MCGINPAKWIGGALLLVAASGAAAQVTVYKCKSPDGHYTYSMRGPEAGKLCDVITRQIASGGHAITKPAPWAKSGTRTATAFAINESDLLTNSHAVSDCHRIKLSPSGAVADVVARDPSLDLAVLRSSARFNASAIFRLQAAQLGEEVVVAGYPLKGLLSEGLHITTGLVSARAGFLNDPSSFQTSAQIQPGSSGGPVFAKSGLVIGVVFRMLDDLAVSEFTGTLPQNVNFAIHASAVRQFLRGHSISFAEQAAVQKRSAEQIAKGADAFTVALECLN